MTTSKKCKHFNDPEQWEKRGYHENEQGTSIKCKKCKPANGFNTTGD